MDRAEWVARCAGRYMEILVLGGDEAVEMARANAETEELRNWTADPARWMDPVEAANEDLEFVVGKGDE